jgi:hypothetical protein
MELGFGFAEIFELVTDEYSNFSSSLNANFSEWYVLQSKVGTRYFFLSPLPLVRYLEIVLPLRAGPLLSKIF